jgi:predicted GNAT superfamily acetyltransferase
MPKYIVRSYAFIECEVEAEDEYEASSVFDNNHPDFTVTGNCEITVLEARVSETMGNEIYDEEGNELLLQDW